MGISLWRHGNFPILAKVAGRRLDIHSLYSRAIRTYKAKNELAQRRRSVPASDLRSSNCGEDSYSSRHRLIVCTRSTDFPEQFSSDEAEILEPCSK